MISLTELQALEDRLARAADDRERVDALNALADYWTMRDHAKALPLAAEAVALATNIPYIEGLAESQRVLMYTYGRTGDYTASVPHTLRLLEFARAHSLPHYEFQALNSLGNFYHHAGDYAAAQQSYMESLKILEGLDNKRSLSALLLNIGIIYGEVGNLSEALAHLHRSVDLAREIGLDALSIARRVQNLAVAYQKTDDYEKAIRYGQEALATFEQEQDLIGSVLALTTIMACHGDMGNFEAAHACYEIGSALAQRLGLDAYLGYVRSCFGQLLMEENRLPEAITVLESALPALERGDETHDLIHAHADLAKAYKAVGNYAAALEHLETYHRLNQEIFNAQSDARLKTLQTVYQVENARLEKEVYRLKSESLEQEIKTREHEEQQRIAINTERERVKALTHLFDATYHDLMTPITVIRTNLYIIDHLDPLDARTVKMRKAVIDHVDELTAKLRDMILVAKLSSDAPGVFDVQAVGLGDLVQTALQQIPAESRGRIVTTDPLPTVKLQADMALLGRALANVLDNGLRYSDPTTTVHLLVSVEADRLVIEVRDAGRGIAPEELAHIGAALYRGEKHRPGGGSTGLGLTITKRVLEKHHATLDYDSTVGVGSVFRLRLPMGT